jgi:hypothetical protein
MDRVLSIKGAWKPQAQLRLRTCTTRVCLIASRADSKPCSGMSTDRVVLLLPLLNILALCMLSRKRHPTR